MAREVAAVSAGGNDWNHMDQLPPVQGQPAGSSHGVEKDVVQCFIYPRLLENCPP